MVPLFPGGELRDPDHGVDRLKLTVPTPGAPGLDERMSGGMRYTDLVRTSYGNYRTFRIYEVPDFGIGPTLLATIDGIGKLKWIDTTKRRMTVSIYSNRIASDGAVRP